MSKKKQTGLAALELDTDIEKKEVSVTREPAVDKKTVIFRVEPVIHKKLSMQAVEDETTIQALMEQAVQLLFAEKGV